MENYFNYFTEIEEHFQQRRGNILFLSTLDWALVETWKDSGIPLEAVLRGIDAAFERYEKRPSQARKVNSLAYCSQEVLAAAEEMKMAEENKDSSVGAIAPEPKAFDPSRIIAFLKFNAEQLAVAVLPESLAVSGPAAAADAAGKLNSLAEKFATGKLRRLEDLERSLTALEEKLFAVLLSATPDDQIVAVRAEADRELMPYRSKMSAAQIQQLHKQYLNKKLLEIYRIPRLSLFYM